MKRSHSLWLVNTTIFIEDILYLYSLFRHILDSFSYQRFLKIILDVIFLMCIFCCFYKFSFWLWSLCFLWRLYFGNSCFDVLPSVFLCCLLYSLLVFTGQRLFVGQKISSLYLFLTWWYPGQMWPGQIYSGEIYLSWSHLWHIFSPNDWTPAKSVTLTRISCPERPINTCLDLARLIKGEGVSISFFLFKLSLLLKFRVHTGG